MKPKTKHPLVAIITGGEVVREVIKKDVNGATYTGYDKLSCFRNHDYTCSYDCSAICLVQIGKNIGLACMANYADGMPIGIVDRETTALEVIECLRWGSDLIEQWERENAKN